GTQRAVATRISIKSTMTIVQMRLATGSWPLITGPSPIRHPLANWLEQLARKGRGALERRSCGPVARLPPAGAQQRCQRWAADRAFADFHAARCQAPLIALVAAAKIDFLEAELLGCLGQLNKKCQSG